ncbi:AbrB/MazE/SpoVT family DNA-binding domain-containing protein [Candidatus Saccharibacteria bacterium CPR2]|nr:AbrB/MazE/SpoVT family DNA-binding domain-containing protein [Candidatus Saccharibacteria bacterium CPR2]
MAQKVIKIGSSLGVTIPKKEVSDLNIIAGDEVEVIIRKKFSRVAKHEKLLKQLEDFMHVYDKDLKNLAKR